MARAEDGSINRRIKNSSMMTTFSKQKQQPPSVCIVAIASNLSASSRGYELANLSNVSHAIRASIKTSCSLDPHVIVAHAISCQVSRSFSADPCAALCVPSRWTGRIEPGEDTTSGPWCSSIASVLAPCDARPDAARARSAGGRDFQAMYLNFHRAKLFACPCTSA